MFVNVLRSGTVSGLGIKYSTVIVYLLLFLPFAVSFRLMNGLETAKVLVASAVVVLMLLQLAVGYVSQRFGLRRGVLLPSLLLSGWVLLSLVHTGGHANPMLNERTWVLLLAGVVWIYFVSLPAQWMPTLARHGAIALLLGATLQALFGMLQLYGVFASFHPFFKVTGTFGNPAPFAFHLMAAVPVALWAYFYQADRPFLKHLAVVSLVAILLIVPATLVRAAWLGSLVAALLVLDARFGLLCRAKGYIAASRLKVPLRVAAGALAVALLAGLYFLKPASANGRMLIWEITLGKVIEAPLFGHGFGRFSAEYNLWQADYFTSHSGETAKASLAGNTVNAFNEFLQILAETGFAGLLLFGGFVLTIGWPAVRSLRGTDKNSLPWLATWLALLVVAMFSYPLYLSVFLVWFVLFAALAANSAIPSGEPAWAAPLWLRLGTGGIALLLIVGMAVLVVPRVKAYNQWMKGYYFYNAGNYTVAAKYYEQVLPLMGKNGELLQHYGKCLQMGGRCSEALPVLQRAVELTADPVLYTTLGDCHTAGGNYNLAETEYRTALAMVPHRLYPRYLLTKMYVAAGDTARAKAMAGEVLALEAKIGSQAVDEIRDEMEAILKTD